MSITFNGNETFANTMQDDFLDTSRPKVLDPVERMRRFGIECSGPYGDGICFLGGEWLVGGEYVQKLTVKNVGTKMRKLKYKLPDVPYFSMVFPELIDLPPGISVEIDVVFRPLQMEVYDDTIYFKICEHVDSGGFHVPCRALISTLQASVPPGLDFGLCPTNETMRYVFQLVNEGEVPAPFEWTCPEPFMLEPMSGVVPVGASVPIEATIFPTDASVFVSLATCEVGKGVHATKPKPILEMRLSAVGRYTHIVPSQERVDFGTLLVGQKEDTTKRIDLENKSTVPATVRCVRVEGDREPVFEFTPTEFVIPPQSSVPVTVTYSPISAGCYTMEHFEFTTPGGNRTSVTCTGLAEAPQVSMHKQEDPAAGGFGVDNSLNFRDVVVGKVNSTSVFLRNESSLPVNYMLVAEKEGAFSYSDTSGTIPPELEVSVRVDFRPTQPTNYYQRVFVIIENAMPFFVDLLGTGYIRPRGEVKEQRPYPMRHAHVQAFRNRCAAGLGAFSPPMLLEVLERDGVSSLFAQKGAQGTGLLMSNGVDRPVTRSGDTTRTKVSVAKEFFFDLNSMSKQMGNGETSGGGAAGALVETNPPPVFLSTDSVEFGFVSVKGTGERRTVTMTNMTHGKVAVQWVVPGEKPNNGGAAEKAGDGVGDLLFGGGVEELPAWDVVPHTVDINPGASCEFKFVFRPQHVNAYFCREVEAYVFFKTQRTFRMVKDPTMQPPWCLKLKGIGHTLTNEQFAGQVALSSFHGVVEFPGSHVGDTTYQTIRLDNHSRNLPAQFQFDSDPSGVFEVKPNSGLIAPGAFAVVLARFSPTSARRYMFEQRCVVNHDPSHAKVVTLKGEGAVPSVRVVEVADLKRSLGLPPLAPGPPLYMKATCTGLVSTRTVTLHNPVRIPIIYSVEIPSRLAGVFAVTPRMGLLRGNQSAKLTVSFAPWEHKEYKLRITIRARAVSGPPPDDLNLDARLVGEAGEAAFVAEEHVTVLAAGSGAVVRFDPPALDFGNLLVNNHDEQEVTLVNESDCDVQFELHHVIAAEKKELVKARAGSSLASNTVADDGSSVEEGEPILQPVPRSGHSSSSKQHPDAHPPLLCVDRPVGILPAHSRTPLKATFQPMRAGEFDVALCALVSAVDPDTGEKIALPAEASAQVRVGDRSRLVSLLKGIPEDHPDFDEDAPLPLSATVVGRASFPNVIVTDVRCLGGGLGGSTRHQWLNLGLEGLNHSLAQPLTRTEIKANVSSSPDLSSLPCYPIRFIPNPVGSEPCVYVMQLTNPGSLTTTFEIHFPNERDIEVPDWADEGEPNEAQLMENRIIGELKSFEIFPRHGTLKSGESVAVTFMYKYNSLDYGGKHELGVHMKINQGKQFRVMLQGETLSDTACRLWQSVPPSDATHRLMPVAIGTTMALAPVQTTELINTGESDLSYTVDTKPLSPEGIPQSYGFQNLFLENPSGTIPARSTHYLRWRFLPLEARDYCYELPLVYEGGAVGKSVQVDGGFVKVAGFGYDPRVDDPHADPLPGINTGLVPPPYQLLSGHSVGAARMVALSRERLTLGRFPQRALHTELIVLRNLSDVAAVEFSWEGSHPLISSEAVRLEPLSGVLEPGGFAPIKLTLNAACAPCIVENQIAVHCRAVPPEDKRKGGKRGTAHRPSISAASFGKNSAPPTATAPSTVAGSNPDTGRQGTGISAGSGGGGGCGGGGGIVSAGGGFGGVAGGRDTIVARQTKSRAAMLGETAPHISRLTGREPALPSRPPPPPRTGDEEGGGCAAGGGGGGGATASGATASHMAATAPVEPGLATDANAGESVCMHLCIWFEVVNEEAFVSQFRSDVNRVAVPRPRTFIPDELPLMFSGAPEEMAEKAGNNVRSSATTTRPKPSRTKSVVEHVNKVRSHTEMASGVVSSFFGSLFNELISRSEVQNSLLVLPQQTKIPLYRDLSERANLMVRLEKAFRVFDTDNSGMLSIKEIKSAIQAMGLKAKTKEAKAFMRSLDQDSDGEVDLKEFLAASMPPEMSLALEDAIENMEYEARLATAEKRRFARMFMPTPGGAMTADRAALAIQVKYRQRQARRQMELKQQLANSADAREMHAAANKLQSQIRARRSREEMRERQERRVAVMRQVALGDPHFQGLIADLMKDTVSNIVEEVLHGEFDLGPPPPKFTFANQGVLSAEISDDDRTAGGK